MLDRPTPEKLNRECYGVSLPPHRKQKSRSDRFPPSISLMRPSIVGILPHAACKDACVATANTRANK